MGQIEDDLRCMYSVIKSKTAGWKEDEKEKFAQEDERDVWLALRRRP